MEDRNSNATTSMAASLHSLLSEYVRVQEKSFVSSLFLLLDRTEHFLLYGKRQLWVF